MEGLCRARFFKNRDLGDCYWPDSELRHPNSIYFSKHFDFDAGTSASSAIFYYGPDDGTFDEHPQTVATKDLKCGNAKFSKHKCGGDVCDNDNERNPVCRSGISSYGYNYNKASSEVDFKTCTSDDKCRGLPPKNWYTKCNTGICYQCTLNTTGCTCTNKGECSGKQVAAGDQADFLV